MRPAARRRRPHIKFAPYGAGYASKPDFARVEHEFPLAPADLAKLTPDNLKSFDQEQIDQIYARLTAGPIPDGPFDGGLFFPKGISGEKRIAEIIGGLPGLAAGVKTEKLELDRQAPLARQGLLSRRARAAQSHRRHGTAEAADRG